MSPPVTAAEPPRPDDHGGVDAPVRRGEVWQTTSGVPVVVLQRDLVTDEVATVVGAVITTDPATTTSALRVRIGDPRAAWVKANLVVTVPRSGLVRRLGSLGPASMGEVTTAVAAVMGLSGPAGRGIPPGGPATRGGSSEDG